MDERQIITVSVGQCGLQLGSVVWQQYCAEHHISKNGKITEINLADNKFNTFFHETSRGTYVPRNIMIDTEPNVIDDIKTSSYAKLYNHRFLLPGKEDAANNFARGHYTVGAEMMDTFTDRLRKLMELCDKCE
eukprot:436527_1